MKQKILLWIGILVLLAVCVGGAVYFNFWNLAAKLLPLIETVSHVPVSEPSAFTVPQGFSAGVFSGDVPGARVMIRDPKGVLLVSLTSEGKVVALPDVNTDGKADSVITVLQKLDGPHGLAILCPDTGNTSADQDACMLYVAESGALKSYQYDADTFSATNPETLATFPTNGGHMTRTLQEAPDGKHLLISIGSSCNVCHEENLLRASIQSFDVVAKKMTAFAVGLRNTVFMAIHPVTGAVWGTDMGRDLLGDDIPPDEVNILLSGKNYGWPNCYGNNIHDTDFDKNTYIRNPCMEPFETPPVVEIPAHSAPLGLAFIPEEGWPEAMRNNLLVAYHGSWNRTVPSGYKIVMVSLDSKGNPPGNVTDFMTGFITPDGKILGRPVGILPSPGGTVYVSDDRAGAIYRITKSVSE